MDTWSPSSHGPNAGPLALQGCLVFALPKDRNQLHWEVLSLLSVRVLASVTHTSLGRSSSCETALRQAAHISSVALAKEFLCPFLLMIQWIGKLFFMPFICHQNLFISLKALVLPQCFSKFMKYFFIKQIANPNGQSWFLSSFSILWSRFLL